MFDFGDPAVTEIAYALHKRVQPSGVVIYGAIPSDKGVLLAVLAATNQPVGHSLERILAPEDTIGSLVVEMNRELVIYDTLMHPLLKDSGAVSRMGIMAYIGVPCCLDGEPVGGISVVDAHRRHWNATEIMAARETAARLEALADLRRQHRQTPG